MNDFVLKKINIPCQRNGVPYERSVTAFCKGGLSVFDASALDWRDGFSISQVNTGRAIAHVTTSSKAFAVVNELLGKNVDWDDLTIEKAQERQVELESMIGNAVKTAVERHPEQWN